MEPLTAADPETVREFRVLARLGAGGMGRVYLATSPAGRFIAVKVIQPQFAYDAAFIRRFRGEADAAQRVSGLYTAPVVAAGVDESPPWLATAFVPGPSLQEVVVRHGPLPPAALWRLAAGLAEALRAIHTAGLVHRDLKPGNVLLAADGPRVIDFGIARAAAAGTRVTAAGAAIGTPSYMSPEQVEGTEVGPASDVFSFGSLLAFAAAGTSPFAGGPGASTPSIMFRVVHGEPALDGVPADIREVVAACLAKDPAQRPDLSQVAARSTAAVEHLGLSPAAFWPDDVAGVIDSHAAAVAEELEALQVPASQSPETPPMAAPLVAPSTHPSARGKSSRRAVLIGAGAAGAAAVGVGVWGLSALAGGNSGGGNSGGNATTGPGSLAWRFAAKQQPNSPTAAGGLVYFGSGLQAAGRAPFYAVSGKTGQRVWAKTMTMVSAPPTVAAGILCAVDSAGILRAVHAATGVQAWQVPGLSADIGERTWAAHGTSVAVVPGDGSVWMFDAATGKKVWESTSPAAAWEYVAMPGTDAVYAFDSARGLVASLSASTGRQRWILRMFAVQSGLTTGLFAGEGAVFAGTQDGSVYCVDAASGQLRWTYAVPGPSSPASDLVIAGGLVYFTDSNGILRAVAIASGQQAWSRQVGGNASPAPAVAVADGWVYVPAAKALQQLHAARGTPGWTYTPAGGTQFVTSAAAGGGLVFAGGSDRAMHAIRA